MKAKKIIGLAVVSLLALAAIGYIIGNYFVTFALERGDDSDPTAAPPACKDIADQNILPAAPPHWAREELAITSQDGLRLVASCFWGEEPSHRWAILVHGYGRNQCFAYDYAARYLEQGYNVLTPDLRAAGLSEGKYVTMGAKEADDIILWAKEIAQHDPEASIVLHGVSLGAATVMLAAAGNPPPNVRAAIEDCGYTDAYAIFTAQVKELFGLPEFPVMACADAVSRLKTGVAISDAAPIKRIASVRIPMMFIHGEADKLVPYCMMGQLYEACGAPAKEKISLPGIGHAVSMPTDPEAYFSQVFAFLDKHM